MWRYWWKKGSEKAYDALELAYLRLKIKLKRRSPIITLITLFLVVGALAILPYAQWAYTGFAEEAVLGAYFYRDGEKGKSNFDELNRLRRQVSGWRGFSRDRRLELGLARAESVLVESHFDRLDQRTLQEIGQHAAQWRSTNDPELRMEGDLIQRLIEKQTAPAVQVLNASTRSPAPTE